MPQAGGSDGATLSALDALDAYLATQPQVQRSRPRPLDAPAACAPAADADVTAAPPSPCRAWRELESYQLLLDECAAMVQHDLRGMDRMQLREGGGGAAGGALALEAAETEAALLLRNSAAYCAPEDRHDSSSPRGADAGSLSGAVSPRGRAGGGEPSTSIAAACIKSTALLQVPVSEAQVRELSLPSASASAANTKATDASEKMRRMRARLRTLSSDDSNCVRR